MELSKRHTSSQMEQQMYNWK